MINKRGGIALSLMIVAGVFVIGLFAGAFVGDSVSLAPKDKALRNADRFVVTNFTPTGLPDLVAVSLIAGFTVCGGGPTGYWACNAFIEGKVSNEGNRSAGRFVISLDEILLYNESIANVVVNGLSFGDSVIFNVTYHWNGTGGNITRPTIRLFADSTQVVRELSESNNIRTIII